MQMTPAARFSKTLASGFIQNPNDETPFPQHPQSQSQTIQPAPSIKQQALEQVNIELHKLDESFEFAKDSTAHVLQTLQQEIQTQIKKPLTRYIMQSKQVRNLINIQNAKVDTLQNDIKRIETEKEKLQRKYAKKESNLVAQLRRLELQNQNLLKEIETLKNSVTYQSIKNMTSINY